MGKERPFCCEDVEVEMDDGSEEDGKRGEVGV
jgi:hypothetical protein